MFKQTNTDSLTSGISVILSLSLHVFMVLVLLGFSFFHVKKEKSEPLAVKLVQPQTAVAKAEPTPLKPEPPKLEPVPVPPKPEPPKPEPVPVPPKLEPVPVPPKLEPVPVPPKLEPVPVPPKLEPVPVPVPVPVPKKVDPPKVSADAPPLPKPVPTKSRADSIRERLQTAPVQASSPARRPVPPAPPVNASSLKERLLADVRTSTVPVSSTPSASSATVAEREAVRYADLVVNPILTPIWTQLGPTKGELGGEVPQPSEIAFIVLADGTITMLRVSQRSNHPAMNRAIERLLTVWRKQKLPGLKESGVESSKLAITITLQAIP